MRDYEFENLEIKENPLFAVRQNLTGQALRKLREDLEMDRYSFAALLGISHRTLETWENAPEKLVTGPAATLATILWEQPGIVERMRIPERKTALRLTYYYKDQICTVIDVDNVAESVSVRNYTDKWQYRAFGGIENPTYRQYLDFLESRCFPRTRDKMKVILEELGLPFYDPFLIILKTKGRLAEDDFWLLTEED